MSKGRILVVDDDAFFRVLCADILTGGGFFVRSASTGKEALALAEAEDFDMVITDLVMPDMNGLEVLGRVNEYTPPIDVIVITGHGSIESAIAALKNGAFDYIMKPLNEDELLHTVESCLEKRKLLEENQEMRQSLRLFEVSRAITSTLDIVKLYNQTLDALLQTVPSQAGIAAFYEPDQKTLALKSARHLNTGEAEAIIEIFKSRFERDLKGFSNITVLAKPEINGFEKDFLKDYRSFFAAPLVKGNTTLGYFILLSSAGKDDYAPREIKSAAFIAEHASAAFENAEKYAEAKEMAFIDSLTNLYNAKYLELVVDREIKRADRLMMPVTVLFLDLDNFKQVNDHNDHPVGSKVLIEIGKILLKCCREVDSVIRYGGDEFVVILVDADYNVAMRVAERIRTSIERHEFMKEDGLRLRITASIGVATYPTHTRDKKELLKTADRAMYKAKDLSRNTVYLAPLPGAATTK